MHWVQFKDNNSKEFRLITIDLGRRQRAEEQIDTYEIPYRNDDLIIHSATYKPYVRNMIFALMDKEKMSLVNQWLTGRGKLRTSKDNEGYFIASIITGLPYEAMAFNVDQFQVGFKVSPFFYLDSGDEKIKTTTQTRIFNPGTIYSEPYIKIVGNGDIDLIINSKIYSFKGVDGYIEVDSDLKIIYRDSLNQGDKMTGELPILGVGENIISWVGSVTSIEILPRWREL